MIYEQTVRREEKSRAILNIQNDSLREYKLRKQKLQEKDKKILALEERLSRIENMLDGLKYQSESIQEK